MKVKKKIWLAVTNDGMKWTTTEPETNNGFIEEGETITIPEKKYISVMLSDNTTAEFRKDELERLIKEKILI